MKTKILTITFAQLLLASTILMGCRDANVAARNESDQAKQDNTESRSEAGQIGDQSSVSRATEADSTVVRFASYNVAMNRDKQGGLLRELQTGSSEQAGKIAEVIQRVRPDVLLLNEFDYDEQGEGLESFCDAYLQKSQNGLPPIDYNYTFFGPVNTGYDSGHDLNNNGKTGEPDDSYGFGQFPGKYAMAILSRYPIDIENIRTFQKFLWKDMPENQWPIDPKSNQSYYNDEIKEIFRLSSKSHWDVPIKIGEKMIHFLVAHPTPPAFDGPEDRNGARNHDEIRMLTDYVSGRADYLYDDKGVKGGLKEGSHFVIAGDLNADPVDGDGNGKAAQQLMNQPNIQTEKIPASQGGPYFAEKQGQANSNQKGDPRFDTADFSDQRPGNLRVDYCLPSASLTMTANGVFWPLPDQPGGNVVGASDHRLVWIDVEK